MVAAISSETASRYTEIFKKGTIVEVSSEDSGLRGSWYTATVIRTISLKTHKILIEYHNLMANESGTKPLREFVDAILVRPIPPREPPSHRQTQFQVMDDVDAFHNDGWWEGVVTDIITDNNTTDIIGGQGQCCRFRYAVFFRCSREQIEFSASDLRLHREWVAANRWLPPFDFSTLSPRQKKKNKDDKEEWRNGNHSGENGGVTSNGQDKDFGRRICYSVSTKQDGVTNSNGCNNGETRISNRSSNKQAVNSIRKLGGQRRGTKSTGNKLAVRRNGNLKEPRKKS